MAKVNKPPLSAEEAIRKRITVRFNQRAEFFAHLASFVAAVGGYVFFSNTFSSTMVALCNVAVLLWGIGILIHAINFIVGEMRENAIERAIERERQLHGYSTSYEDAYAGLDEKPKRNRLALTDDGELEEISEPEDYPQPRGKKA